ncbi:MAG: DUF721 domain-containing protein [Desulfobulbaceae bacterium]|jgi:hypothetical protein|nr:DUF721 domain-containing protein [Desulfobulbaceae bacterium]
MHAKINHQQCSNAAPTQLAENKDMKNKRVNSRNPDLPSLGDTMSAVYSSKNWKQQWRLFRLSQDWPAIVGTEIGRLTSPAFFRQDALWIFVQDSAWMQHMQFIKLDLLKRLNKVLEEQPVTDIRWLLPPEILAKPKRQVSEPLPISPQEEQTFRAMTESVANQECREALHRLWQTLADHSK